MGVITDIRAPWRMRLVPASFRRVQYHVEQQARSAGRRVAVHEYPKRDKPYSEDMGRHAIRYQVVGYVIGPSYHIQKSALIAALDAEDAGPLVDPYLPINDYLGYSGPVLFVCERYSVTEARERGGYAAFEMLFVEAGEPGNSLDIHDPAQDVNAAAALAVDASITSMNAVLDQLRSTQ
jgi:prophage DNA circulation protein